MNGASSDFFSCNVGVRQGENCPHIYSLWILMTWNKSDRKKYNWFTKHYRPY